MAAQFVGIAGRCLPEKRGQIVVNRAAATALEVDERRIFLQHYIPRLKIAIHKTPFVGIFSGSQIGSHLAKIGLKFQFVEVDFGRFQEAIFEIIEVEHHVLLVERRLRIAHAPVQTLGTEDLQARQKANRRFQKLDFGLVVLTTSLTTLFQRIEKRCRTQIGLQIARFVGAHSKNLGHRQFFL